jgi:hypothetical protein
MWSLTSQRERRTSGPENSQSQAKKDFFNTIGTFRTYRDGLLMSASGGEADMLAGLKLIFPLSRERLQQIMQFEGGGLRPG